MLARLCHLCLCTVKMFQKEKFFCKNYSLKARIQTFSIEAGDRKTLQQFYCCRITFSSSLTSDFFSFFSLPFWNLGLFVLNMTANLRNRTFQAVFFNYFELELHLTAYS